MIKHILVPIDGSRHAQKALELAIDLATRYGAELTLVHALLRGQVPDEIRKLSDRPGGGEPAMAVGAAYVDFTLPRDVLEDIAEKLLQSGARLAQERGVKTVHTHWGPGDPAHVILDWASRHETDMIVIGSRGLGDLRGLIVGSVSHKVQHVFEGTVVTVK